MAHVTAYRKKTGEKVRVPAHWLDHKVLGKPFTKNPPKSASAPAAAAQKKEA